MKLLDRYFFHQLLICLIFCLLTFVFFYVMIDLFGRLDEIIESKIPLETIANYYLSLIPLIFVRMCPLAILLATMYVLNNLSRNNEIIAAVSGGIHPNRILVPFLITGILLSAISMAVSELNVPKTAQKAYHIKQTLIKGRKEQYLWSNRIFYGCHNRRFYVKLLNSKKNTLSGIMITEYDENGFERSKFDANTARWDNGKWKFYNAALRTFDSPGREKSTILADEVRADEKGWIFLNGTLFTNRGAKTFNRMCIKLPVIEEIPEDFTKKQLRPEEMSFKELKCHIERLQKIGFNPQEEIVNLHNKMSLPLASFVVILIGIPFAIRQRRGGILVGFGNALAICLVYYLLQTTGNVLGENLIPAVLGAWFANAIFGVIGIINLARTPYLIHR